MVVLSISFASLAGSLWLLSLLVVIGGFGAAIMHPEAGKYAALLSGSRKSGGISIFQIGGSLGFALGPITIAALLAHFGRFGSLVMLPPGLVAVAYVYVVIRRAHVMAQPAHETQRKLDAAGAGTDRPRRHRPRRRQHRDPLPDDGRVHDLLAEPARRARRHDRRSRPARHRVLAGRHHRNVPGRLFGRPLGLGHGVGHRAGGGGPVPARIFLRPAGIRGWATAARQRACSRCRTHPGS